MNSGCFGLGWLNLFNAELSPKRYWRGPRSRGWGKRETVPNTTRLIHALRWAAMRAILMFPSLTDRDKVTRLCPQTTTFEERGEPKRNRTEVFLLASLTLYQNQQQQKTDLISARKTSHKHNNNSLSLHRRCGPRSVW